jgi:tetratricopeptide (TPR) repeat protein
MTAAEGALRIVPDDEYATTQRAVLLCDLKRFDEAATAAGEAMKRHPQSDRLRLVLAWALSMSFHHEEALLVLKEYVTRVPDNPDGHEGCGHSLAKLERPVEALVYYEKAISLAPDDARLLANYAETLADAGRFGESVRSFRRSLEMDPGVFEKNPEDRALWEKAMKRAETEEEGRR